jgi:hypothetical protein
MKPRELNTAYERVISRILEISYDGKKDNLNLIHSIEKMYNLKGGLWVKFFRGDTLHTSLLKQCTKKLVKAEEEINDRRRKAKNRQ